MSNKQPAAEIIRKIVDEIIAEKGYIDGEKEIMLNKTLNLIGLAMAGYISQQDMQRAKNVIEDE